MPRAVLRKREGERERARERGKTSERERREREGREWDFSGLALEMRVLREREKGREGKR